MLNFIVFSFTLALRYSNHNISKLGMHFSIAAIADACFVLSVACSFLQMQVCAVLNFKFLWVCGNMSLLFNDSAVTELHGKYITLENAVYLNGSTQKLL